MTTYEYQGYGSRLIESIKGVVFGVVLFVVSIPLLWWNEGRAVQTARSLREVAAECDAGRPRGAAKRPGRQAGRARRESFGYGRGPEALRDAESGDTGVSYQSVNRPSTLRRIGRQAGAGLQIFYAKAGEE